MVAFSRRLRMVAKSWPTLITVLALSACAGFQLYITQLPVPYLLEHAVNDDTFYYLEIAYRSAQGQGSTFDGIHFTNGFQPAWKAVLTAIASLIHDKESLLRSALIVCVALNLIAGFFFFSAARLIMPSSTALAPLFLWAGVQLEPHLSLSGMETSLNWVFFNLFLFYLLRFAVVSEPVGDRVTIHSLRRVGTIGLLGGLLFYARVDNTLFIGGTALIVGLLPGLLRIKNDSGWKLRGFMMIAVLAIAAFWIVPYLISNALTFGTMLPISGLAKQKLNYDLVTAGMGGYLSLETAVHSLNRAIETVTWTFAQLLRVFGGGKPLWLAAPRLFLVITITFLLATGIGVLTQIRWSTIVRHPSIFGVLSRIIYETAVVQVLFWTVYALIGHFITTSSLQAGLKGLLVAVTLLLAYVRGAHSAKNGSASLSADNQIMTLLLILLWLHAYILSYTLDHFLTYTSWYFANWFVILALWMGIALRELVYSDARYRRVRWVLSLCALVWLGGGLIVSGVRAFQTVRAPLSDPPYGINGQYQMSQWLRTNTPANTVLASFNAGTIGYFSDRTTVNLDGLVNDMRLLEYNYHLKDMTAYLDSLCPDFVVDYLDNISLAEGQLPSGATIWGIDRRRLQPVYWLQGQGWEGRPQAHVVFRYDRSYCRP